jgi:hypothetical protein
MELELWGNKLKYENGEIWNYRTLNSISKKYDWFKIKFSEKRDFRKKEQKWMIYYYCMLKNPETKKSRQFVKHRLVYKLHNPEWDIMDTSQDNFIDHIDGMNNDISNLRVVTNQKNMFNTKSKGYTRNQNKWLSQIVINREVKNLGRFETKEEAHEAYLKAKEKYHII